MNPLTYIILFGSVVFGALIVKIFKAQSGKRMKLLIAFSGAYLFVQKFTTPIQMAHTLDYSF